MHVEDFVAGMQLSGFSERGFNTLSEHPVFRVVFLRTVSSLTVFWCKLPRLSLSGEPDSLTTCDLVMWLRCFPRRLWMSAVPS